MPSENDINKNRAIIREHDRDLASIFKSLGEINRFRIFKLVMAAPMITVSAVAKILDISVPLASQHVKLLEAAQLLTKIRSGKIVHLQLNLENPVVDEVVQSIRLEPKPRAAKKQAPNLG